MAETLIVTLLPVLFLIVLFGGEARFRRAGIDQGGEPPIDKRLFLMSKYSIIVLWGAMILQSWGVNLSFIQVPGLFEWIALCLWVFGFALLFIGRLGLASSFRIGSPEETTALKVGGLFSFSRNPMYLGVFATIVASILYTLNPLVLLVGVFVIAVHHRIVLAEEQYLRTVFGQEYADYCGRVRRYL
jgi:protein-S-isoprenylcysteine O-methyltransferase Ste14